MTMTNNNNNNVWCDCVNILALMKQYTVEIPSPILTSPVYVEYENILKGTQDELQRVWGEVHQFFVGLHELHMEREKMCAQLTIAKRKALVDPNMSLTVKNLVTGLKTNASTIEDYEKHLGYITVNPVIKQAYDNSNISPVGVVNTPTPINVRNEGDTVGFIGGNDSGVGGVLSASTTEDPTNSEVKDGEHSETRSTGLGGFFDDPGAERNPASLGESHILAEPTPVLSASTTNANTTITSPTTINTSTTNSGMGGMGMGYGMPMMGGMGMGMGAPPASQSKEETDEEKRLRLRLTKDDEYWGRYQQEADKRRANPIIE